MRTIQMGNDEFILYIRKLEQQKKAANIPVTSQSNEVLGRKIWEWLRDNKDASAKKTIEDQPCFWDIQGVNINAKLLPKTATQFLFDRKILEQLYDFLDTL